MTDSGPSTPAGVPQAPQGVPGNKNATAKMPTWLFRTILGVVAGVVLVVAYLIASVTVPLVWANAIRDQVGGQLGNSIPLGMFYGFTFTFIPVLVVWQARRKNLNKWVRIALLTAGLLLAMPNLLTLSVLYGSTETAADARVIWAMSSNWFGTWSQLFMVLGVVSGIGVIVLGRMWLRRGKRIREIKTAQKLVREKELAQARADKEDAKAAGKAAKAAARANRRHLAGNAAANPDTSAGVGTPGESPQA
ncbi:MAG: hypothetical protein ABI563_06600 [Specibacter sp.]